MPTKAIGNARNNARSDSIRESLKSGSSTVTGNAPMPDSTMKMKNVMTTPMTYHPAPDRPSCDQSRYEVFPCCDPEVLTSGSLLVRRRT